MMSTIYFKINNQGKLLLGISIKYHLIFNIKLILIKY